MKYFLLVVAAIVFNGCNSFPVDKAMAAWDGGEPTAFVEGCGDTVRKGLIGVALREGANPSCRLRVYVPKSNCDRSHCAFVQLWRKDGSQGYGVGIPKDQTSTSFTVSEVIGHTSPVEISDRGPYLLTVGVYWKDPEDHDVEKLSKAKAWIRVIVLDGEYQVMPCGHPAVAWKVNVGDTRLETSTAYRTAVCQ